MERVLVVEDDKIVVELYEHYFGKLGRKFDWVGDGEQALNKIKSAEPYDIIFLDLSLPSMDGVTLLQEIKKLSFSRPPVVAMITSKAAQYDRDVCMMNGADHYFVKPVSLDTFRSFFDEQKAC